MSGAGRALVAAALGAALLGGVALALAQKPAAPAGPAAAGAAAPAAADAPAKFDHASHAALTPPVDVASCATCHKSGPDGALVAPGKDGHQPCLASGCHVDDFLASGARTAREDPARHGKATRFCRGCHESAPARASKALASVAFKNNPSPDHHVEMNHLEHAGKTSCRSCHVVDGATFALVKGAPGHAECATCHGKAADAAPMDRCQACHSQPSEAIYLGKPRSSSDVRSCDTESHAALAAERKEAVPCFTHERTEHRTRDGAPMECSSCHFMVADQARWGGKSYRTLKDLRSAPIIHNQRDLAHQSCGSRGCHSKDVDDSRGTARCKLCHSSKVVEQSIFD
jgi:hypothetical protein